MVKKNKEVIKKEEEFQQRIIDVARVTRVMAGGKRMKFRVCLAIGDKKGRVGIGIAKGSDVTMGISKALDVAKKNLVKVPLFNETIIHSVDIKFKAAKVLLKPAKKGAGIKAGGPVRTLCELAGIPNITGKILGSNNKINIAKATIIAFASFKKSKKAQEESKADESNLEEKSTENIDKKEPQKSQKKKNSDKFKKMLNKDEKNK
ncbi:MAG: 30S ribosomal protein S5 [Candidatus Buchananbacteria bacterium]|nr:30S ribosomal protein S5 [Candidatus Buchananbacteria bacterium]